MKNRNTIRGGWILSILLLFVFIPGCFIGTTTFQGRVVDIEYNPISSVYLLFVQREAHTDEDGNFFFSSVPYGIHKLYVNTPFYKDKEFLVDIDHPYYILKDPILLEPYKWQPTIEDGYIYKEDERFDILSSFDGVNFSEEYLVSWGNDLIDRFRDIVGTESIIPYHIFMAWPDDNLRFEKIMAFTLYGKDEIHILKRVLKIKDFRLKREIFAHEFTHLFLYKFAHIKTPYIQEGLAYYLPSFIFGYGRIYDYKYYKKGLIHYLIPSHIPTWREAGKIYSHPEDTKIFWFSAYELRSIFYFLQEKYGKDKILLFIKKLKEYNEEVDRLFLDIFGEDIPTLEKMWKNYFSLPGVVKQEPGYVQDIYVY